MSVIFLTNEDKQELEQKIKQNADTASRLSEEIEGIKQNETGGTSRWTDNAVNLMILLLRQMGFKTDQTANIDALEIELTSSSSNTSTLTSIDADFSQGDNIIYTTESLSKLKDYLTVTAIYDNGTTKEVTSYVLSGELTEGTSVITVSYGGKTATFTCTVTKAESGEGEEVTNDNITIESNVLTIVATSNASISDGVLTVM